MKKETNENVNLGIISHTIGNFLYSSGIAPLNKLKRMGVEGKTIDQALEGMDLLFKILNTLTKTMRPLPSHWHEDYYNGDGIFFSDLKFTALYTAVGNMLNSKYGNEHFLYFPTKESIDSAISEFHDLDENEENLWKFIEKHLQVRMTEVTTSIAESLRIGDKYFTATKIMIVLQELYQNAFKNVLFAKECKRNIDLKIKTNVIGEMTININNTCSSYQGGSSSTEIGGLVIKHILEQMKVDYQISQKDDQFSFEFTLKM